MGRTTKGDRSAHHTRGDPVNPATAPPVQFYMPSIQAAAASFAIQASTAPVHTTDGIEGVITTLARDPGGGLIMMPDTFNVTNRELILALAARYGVPVVSNNPIFAESGSLITYGVDFTELFREAGRLHRSHPQR
jgi:putative ABC transport system substrate-binding protein